MLCRISFADRVKTRARAGSRKIISASGAVVQEYIAGDSFWIQKLLVAITAWSFHTVCLIFVPEVVPGMS
jgi:hypothetical protein